LFINSAVNVNKNIIGYNTFLWVTAVAAVIARYCHSSLQLPENNVLVESLLVRTLCSSILEQYKVYSVLCWLGSRKGIRPVKTELWDAGMVICLGRGADLHMA